jgi:hypothetical protein
MPSRAELVNRANVMGLDPTNYPNDSKLEQKVIWLETQASTMAGTLAAGTLTTTGSASADGDTILIGTTAQGGVTYTLKTALSGVKASSTLTSDATAPSDGDTVTIGYLTYTFRTALSSPAQAFEVLIGGTAAIALDNLKLAINKGSTEGTQYSFGTYAHPEVTAEANADTTQEVTAKQFGTSPNNIPTVEASAHLAWDSTTLGGAGATAGVANVVNEVLLGADAEATLVNLKKAINDSGTEGTHYSVGTAPHPLVTAGAITSTTLVVTAIDMANGEDMSTTDPVDANSRMSWGATTLASGVADQNAVNATAKAQTSGGANV